MFFDNEQLKQIMEVAKNAGDEIMKLYSKATDFQMKDDETPLTEADLLSHKVVVNGLSAITPDINILSEESEMTPFNERKTWDEYWLIDPLDGTRGFIDKTDDFCVCLSYIKNNEPIFGLIYAPVLDIYYLANSRDIAYKIKGDNWQQISVKKPHNPLKVVVGRYSINKKRINQHLVSSFGENEYEISGVGSALKFCFIAEGKYDYYPAIGVCSEWDTAAGSFILHSAGGYVIDMFDNYLKYNTKNDILSPMFFASGDFRISRSN
jgi:3'(2'), 5'-bisphosphate nucleotidase